jgi:hypothetical protein
MNFKPDESTLISYIFGELDEQERTRVHQFLLEHPDEYERVKAMADTLVIMDNLRDKEVIAPPVFAKETASWVHAKWIRTSLGIAASLILLLVAGKILDFKIHYGQGELQLGFGERTAAGQASKTTPGMTSDDVQAMIHAALVRNNESVSKAWAEDEKRIDQSVRKHLEQTSAHIDKALQDVSRSSQQQVHAFVSGLQDDNLRLVKDYMKLSGDEQKKYIEGLLVDFSKYLQEQRNQDLQLFQTRMNSIEQNNDLFKQETEKILSSIVSTPGTPGKQNNY